MPDSSFLLAQPLAAFLGLVVLLLIETVHPFFDLFRSNRERGVHLVRNLALGALNAVLVAVVFAGLWVAASSWAATNGWGVLTVLGLPVWAHALGAVLLLDAWTYLWHRMNHRIPLLWRFHRVHHTDASMDVTTAGRFHVGELVLSSALRIPLLIGLGVYAWELVLYETLMLAVVQFHHANVMLPSGLDRVLRTVIVTPAMHKVHHSRLQPETDSNYSALFSLWDRLFRSFRLRAHPNDIEFGLDRFDSDEQQTFSGLLAMPFREPPRPRTEPEDD